MSAVYEEYQYFFEKCGITKEQVKPFKPLEVDWLGDIVKEYVVSGLSISLKEFIEGGEKYSTVFLHGFDSRESDMKDLRKRFVEHLF